MIHPLLGGLAAAREDSRPDGPAAWVVLGRARAMNPILFGAKRAFLSSVAVTRKTLRAIAPGMTAARYDMMFFIAGEPTRQSMFKAFRMAVTQSAVRKQLGVSAPVVSRMVRSLVARGWVRQSRGDFDKRQRTLELTDEGVGALLAAFRQAGRLAKRLVIRTFCGERDRHWAARSEAMQNADSSFSQLRTACGDTARAGYSWPWPSIDDWFPASVFRELDLPECASHRIAAGKGEGSGRAPRDNAGGSSAGGACRVLFQE
jgi:DNA-binding MarR family transcriptional regulator